jgi:hypothetical protein
VKVAADGSITSTEVLGGNPVFVKAALGAIEKWRWARASGETAEVVRLAFGRLCDGFATSASTRALGSAKQYRPTFVKE